MLEVIRLIREMLEELQKANAALAALKNSQEELLAHIVFSTMNTETKN